MNLTALMRAQQAGAMQERASLIRRLRAECEQAAAEAGALTDWSHPYEIASVAKRLTRCLMLAGHLVPPEELSTEGA